MTFELTPEQLAVQELAKQFAESVVAPIAEKVDKEGFFPADTFKQLAEQGLISVDVPVEYGGSGLDLMSESLTTVELAKKCGSTAIIHAVLGTVNHMLMDFGTEEQKAKYLPMVAQGKIGAFALTEPGAGSDAAAGTTKAVLDGDEYVINGTKCFITNVGPDCGDFVIVLCNTDPEKGVRGKSAIIVDRGTPGFNIGKTESKFGCKGSNTSELVFEDCRVPKANLIGKEGEGFKVFMKALDGGRISIAALALGLGKAALEESVKYAKQRVAFGKPISEQPVIQDYIAEMATRLEVSECIMYKAIDLSERKLPYSKEATMAKYYAGESAVYAADRAIQIFGGYGYMKDYPVERIYRDARICTIGEGTSEIQKMVIAKTILK